MFGLLYCYIQEDNFGIGSKSKFFPFSFCSPKPSMRSQERTHVDSSVTSSNKVEYGLMNCNVLTLLKPRDLPSHDDYE
jgi:hypothetical protein